MAVIEMDPDKGRRMIDTLKFAETLEAAGLDRRVTEAQARAINEALSGQAVTRTELQSEIRPLRWMIGANTALILLTLAAVLGS